MYRGLNAVFSLGWKVLTDQTANGHSSLNPPLRYWDSGGVNIIHSSQQLPSAVNESCLWSSSIPAKENIARARVKSVNGWPALKSPTLNSMQSFVFLGSIVQWQSDQILIWLFTWGLRLVYVKKKINLKRQKESIGWLKNVKLGQN